MTETEIILHHYPLSTFSEKARLAFGLKRLAYRHVIVPVQAPKPDQTALTGGYRRAPMMQIGADIWVDTHLMLRKLEELYPEPTLYPDGCEGQAAAISFWVERDLWFPALGIVANVNSHLYDPAFVAERKAFGYLLGKEDVAPLWNRYVQQFHAHCVWLAKMFADGRPYILGDTVSAADLAAFPTVWFLRKWAGEHLAGLPVAPLFPWADRVATLGHGTPTEIAGGEAVEIARVATPLPSDLPPDGDPTGIADGTRVTVTPDDFGKDPVEGVLVGASNSEVVIRREDPRAGTVHVHFPRAGYDVVAV